MSGFLQRQVSLNQYYSFNGKLQLSEPKNLTSCPCVRLPVSLGFFLVLSFVWPMKRLVSMGER